MQYFNLRAVVFSTVEIRYSKTSSVLDLAVKMSRFACCLRTYHLFLCFRFGSFDMHFIIVFMFLIWLFSRKHISNSCHVNLVVRWLLGRSYTEFWLFCSGRVNLVSRKGSQRKILFCFRRFAGGRGVAPGVKPEKCTCCKQ